MGIATQICLLSCACTATAARFGAETLRNALGSPPKERRYAGAPPVVALQRQFDRCTAGFGLHYVDFDGLYGDKLERYPKDSAKWFAKRIAQGGQHL